MWLGWVQEKKKQKNVPGKNKTQCTATTVVCVEQSEFGGGGGRPTLNLIFV